MKYLILVLVLIVLNASTAFGEALEMGNNQLTDANIELIKAGMQQEEVLRIVGEPDETVQLANGNTELIYRGSIGKADVIRAKRLAVEVTDSGFVANVIYDEILDTSN